jgi:hypothetical protein
MIKINFRKGMLAACLFLPLFTFGQSEIDALRYSQVLAGSTARSLSMGGAFGALGADFSTLSTNPAGIAIYRKSEFSFSTGFNGRGTKSEFLGSTDKKGNFSIDLPNLGIVLANAKDNTKSDWKQFGFGLGYNRTANFNSEFFYEAKNPSSSILDYFVDQVNLAGGATPNDLFENYPFDVDLAWQTFLINPANSDTTLYESVIPNGGAYQSRSHSTSGGMGEFSLAFGGSYQDRLFFGISLAFPSIRYEEESRYREEDKDNEIISGDSISGYVDFRSLSYDQYLLTTGNGFNAKFGVIIKPIEWLRIGAAIHTPTWYNMTDVYRSSMRSSFANGSSYSYDSPDGSYTYDLKTPFRAIGSLGILFGPYGLISLEYELTDYTSSKLDSRGYNFRDENAVINRIHSDFASNFRGGMEWKYQKFSFRAGAAYYSSPFKSDVVTKSTDQHVISYSGGLGFRDKKFYVDVAYVFSERSEFYSPYTLSYENVPGTTLTKKDHRVITTVGFRF